jgi:hypothetical protein
MDEEQKKKDNHIEHQKNMSHTSQEEQPAHHGKSQHKHGNHHAHMVKYFRTRFWISPAVSVPWIFSPVKLIKLKRLR